jgi:hypothetical protein
MFMLRVRSFQGTRDASFENHRTGLGGLLDRSTRFGGRLFSPVGFGGHAKDRASKKLKPDQSIFLLRQWFPIFAIYRRPISRLKRIITTQKTSSSVEPSPPSGEKPNQRSIKSIIASMVVEMDRTET